MEMVAVAEIIPRTTTEMTVKMTTATTTIMVSLRAHRLRLPVRFLLQQPPLLELRSHNHRVVVQYVFFVRVPSEGIPDYFSSSDCRHNHSVCHQPSRFCYERNYRDRRQTLNNRCICTHGFWCARRCGLWFLYNTGNRIWCWLR